MLSCSHTGIFSLWSLIATNVDEIDSVALLVALDKLSSMIKSV